MLLKGRPYGPEIPVAYLGCAIERQALRAKFTRQTCSVRSILSIDRHAGQAYTDGCSARSFLSIERPCGPDIPVAYPGCAIERQTLRAKFARQTCSVRSILSIDRHAGQAYTDGCSARSFLSIERPCGPDIPVAYPGCAIERQTLGDR